MVNMRRKERQVTDPAVITECLQKSEYMNVAFYDNGDIYVVPVNFGYVIEDDTYTIYFHGAKAGRKAALALASPKVGFDMVSKAETVSADKACDFTEHFLSIIGQGNLTVLSDAEDKKAGLDAVMVKATGKTWDYPEAMVNATNVYKIEVTELSCKKNK